VEDHQRFPDLIKLKTWFKNVYFVPRKNKPEWPYLIFNLGRLNFQANWREDGELVIVDTNSDSRKAFPVAYDQIKHLIEAPNYPTLQIRNKFGITENVKNLVKFELFAHSYSAPNVKLPVLQIQTEKHPDSLYLMPTSGVYYCPARRLYKQVYSLIESPWEWKKYVTDFEFTWPENPNIEELYSIVPMNMKFFNLDNLYNNPHFYGLPTQMNVSNDELRPDGIQITHYNDGWKVFRFKTTRPHDFAIRSDVCFGRFFKLVDNLNKGCEVQLTDQMRDLLSTNEKLMML